MPREAVIKARRERNEALIDVMLLAATADGHVAPIELSAMLKRISERPEFDGMKPAELAELVESSLSRLSKTRQLDEVLKALRTRLPNHENRLLAFGLACAVALADNRTPKEELGLLKSLQRALGVSELEVARLFDVVQQGRSVADALAPPTTRLYAETMVLVASCDGVVDEAEGQAMLESFAGDPAFQKTSIAEAQRHLVDAVKSLSQEGLPERLTVLAQGLSTHGERCKAWELASRVAHSDGEPTQKEAHMLELLQATFGLADDEVALLTARSQSRGAR